MASPNNKASLGCGTLILIALIVMIFGNAKRGDGDQLKSQLASLQSDIADLKADVKNQSELLTKIKESLEESNKRSLPRPRVVPPPIEAPSLEAPLPEN